MARSCELSLAGSEANLEGIIQPRVATVSAQSGSILVVPSAIRNGFQSFGNAAGMGLGISGLTWLNWHEVKCFKK
jgi:hypothetical protein